MRRLIADANVNKIISCMNLLQTDFERETVQDCNACLLQPEVPNNICKQCIANNILFPFLLRSEERPLLRETCLWCQSQCQFTVAYPPASFKLRHWRRLLTNYYASDNFLQTGRDVDSTKSSLLRKAAIWSLFLLSPWERVLQEPEDQR